MEARGRDSRIERLRHERYTPEELASLLEIPVEVIYGAAFRNELPARIENHDVIVHREDALAAPPGQGEPDETGPT